MSADVLPLWGVAAALYAWECLVPVRRDRLTIASRGRRFRAMAGRALPGTRRTGFLLANPLPPFGQAFLLGGEPSDDRSAGDTDFRAIRRRLEQVYREVMPLNAVGAISFAGIFVALPVAESLSALPAAAPWLFGVVLLAHLASISLRRRALRRLGLRAEGSESFLIAFSPLSSLRAGGTLAARAFDGFEPLAVSFVLLPARDFLELARQHVREEPKSGAVHRVLSAAGIDAAELDGHMLGEDDAARSFCPRCRTFFALDSGACTDCGTPLLPHDASRRAAAQRLMESVAKKSLELCR